MSPLQKDDRRLPDSLERPPALSQTGAGFPWSELEFGRATLRAAPASPWGWLPGLGLSAACGLFLIAIAYSASRIGQAWAEPLFWIGLLALVAPIVFRLASREAGRQERIALAALLGLALYAVKLLHSPFTFTFADELPHLHNLNQILQDNRLFQGNPLLPVTPLYPGLESVAAALADLSGFSPFLSSVLVIGAARLLIMLALFLFHERVSGSSRAAGLAAAFYIANSNFLFWSAQFAYESLALPLAVFFGFVLACQEKEQDGPARVGLKMLALATLLSVVITHHLTSYALVAFLWLASVAGALVRFLSPDEQRRSRLDTWGLALFSLVTTVFWLAYAASQTFNYLDPIFGSLARSIFELVARGEPGRELFQTNSGYVAPLWERLVGIGSVILVLIGVPFGLLQIWIRYRNNILAIVLAGASLVYFPLLMLRFTPAGWEPSNRSSAFLFIGIAFVLAIGAERFWLSRWSGWASRLAFTTCAALVFIGGVIAGWPPALRLSQPFVVYAGEIPLVPQGLTASRWARQHLGPGNRIAADESNARLLLAYGDQHPLTGRSGGIRYLFFSNQIDWGELQILRENEVAYVAFDRRRISWDNMQGLYFYPARGGEDGGRGLMEPESYLKFERQEGVSRIFDSGNLLIYDVGALSDEPPAD